MQGLVGGTEEREKEGGIGSHTPLDDGWGAEEGYFSSYTHFKIHEDMLKV